MKMIDKVTKLGIWIIIFFIWIWGITSLYLNLSGKTTSTQAVVTEITSKNVSVIVQRFRTTRFKIETEYSDKEWNTYNFSLYTDAKWFNAPISKSGYKIWDKVNITYQNANPEIANLRILE